MLKQDASFLINYFDRLVSDRSVFDVAFQDICSYLRPQKGPIFSDDMPGTQRGSLIYHSGPQRVTTRLSAALGSLLTNAESNWFMLSTDIEELNKKQESMEWFDDTTRVLMRIFENSNFYTEVAKFYTDLITFGTAILFIDRSKNPDRSLVFQARDVKEIYVSENSEGFVDTIFRDCKMTARQVVEEFEEEGQVSENVKKIYAKDPEEYINLLHAVFPRGKKGSEKKDKPFASVWIEKDKKNILRKSGYDTFPYVVARWVTETGEKYGRSPGMEAMPDIKMLSKMQKTMLKASQYAADPILAAPNEGLSSLKDKKPGSVVFYDASMNAELKYITNGSNIPLTQEIIQGVFDSVADTFYATQLQLIDRREMTAEEVRARQSENARILGPTFGTLNYEFLSPLIERVVDILGGELNSDGSKLLPEAPDSIQGQYLRLKFVSPLAKAQRLHESMSITSTVQAAMQWSEREPSVMDNIDLDIAIRTVSETDGSPANILRSEDDVVKIRQVRMQQRQDEQQAQLQQMQASTAKDGSAALKNTAKAMEEK
jgi:hypothetical protein